MNRRQFLKAAVVGVAATQIAQIVSAEEHGLTAGDWIEFPAPALRGCGFIDLYPGDALRSFGLRAGDYVSVVDEENGIDEIMQVVSAQGKGIQVMRGCND